MSTSPTMTKEASKLFNAAVIAKDMKKLEYVVTNKNYTFDIDKPVERELTALHLAIISGNTGMVKLLIKHGASVHLSSEYDNSCLHLAAKIGNVELVNLFLKLNPDVNATNNFKSTPLHDAIKYNKYGVAQLLIEKNAKVNAQNSRGDTPLHFAVENRYIPTVKLLLTHRANPNLKDNEGNSAFHKSFEWLESENLMDFFVKHGANLNLKTCGGENALHLAVKCNAQKIAQKLLQMRMNVNEMTKSRETPLHFLLQDNKKHTTKSILDMLKILADYGLDVDVADGFNLTPLYYAVRRESLKVFNYLLDLGANINGMRRCRPVLAAVQNGELEAAKCLIEHGAKVKLKNEKNESALHIAIRWIESEEKRREMVEFLVYRGVKIDEKDANEDTAVKLALEKRDLRLFEWLIERGASVDERLLCVAVDNELSDVVEKLIGMGVSVGGCGDVDGMSFLAMAALKGNVEIAKVLLDNGASANDEAALLQSINCEKDNVEMLRLLEDRGAEVDDKIYRTMLVKAIRCARVEMVEFLLSNDVDVNLAYNGLVPLELAFNYYQCERAKYEPIVKCLIEHLAKLMKEDAFVSEVNVDLIKSKVWMLEWYCKCLSL